VVTTTLLNRSFDLPKTFCLNNTGAVLSAELYSADDVVPGTEFSVSTLAAVSENGTVKIVLPPHSLAVIRTEVA